MCLNQMIKASQESDVAGDPVAKAPSAQGGPRSEDDTSSRSER